jgi:hypothetical protein
MIFFKLDNFKNEYEKEKEDESDDVVGSKRSLPLDSNSRYNSSTDSSVSPLNNAPERLARLRISMRRLR